jgi:hypothetical protein
VLVSYVDAYAASNETSTPSHKALYALMECWLRFLVNISERFLRFSSKIFQAYGSFRLRLRRTSDGFTLNP